MSDERKGAGPVTVTLREFNIWTKSEYSSTGRHVLSDDDSEGSQKAIESIKKAVTAHGGRYQREKRSEPERRQPSVLGRRVARYPGSSLTTISELQLLLGMAGTAAVVLRAIRPLVIQWMKNMAERSVRVKWGDREVEIHGSDDVDKVIEALERLQPAEASKQPVSEEVE